jgi:hypothetical protein
MRIDPETIKGRFSYAHLTRQVDEEAVVVKLAAP